jgi:hypothetical protein
MSTLWMRKLRIRSNTVANSSLFIDSSSVLGTNVGPRELDAQQSLHSHSTCIQMGTDR